MSYAVMQLQSALKHNLSDLQRLLSISSYETTLAKPMKDQFGFSLGSET
jgi:hypothetical protein